MAMNTRDSSLAFYSLDERTVHLARTLEPNSDDWSFSKDTSMDSAYGSRAGSRATGIPAVPLYDYLHLAGDDGFMPGLQFPQVAVPDIQRMDLSSVMAARLRAANTALPAASPSFQPFEDPFAGFHDSSSLHAAAMTTSINPATTLAASQQRQVLTPGALARQQRASADLMRGKRRRTGTGTDGQGLSLSLASPLPATTDHLKSAVSLAGRIDPKSAALAAHQADASALPAAGGSAVTSPVVAAAVADVAGGGVGRLDGKVSDDRRRKRLLRNRVSAQQARERKRNYIQEMEHRCSLVEDSNADLEDSIAQLEQENAQLRLKMRQVVQGTAT